MFPWTTSPTTDQADKSPVMQDEQEAIAGDIAVVELLRQHAKHTDRRSRRDEQDNSNS